MFPAPIVPETRRCRRCGHRARADRMISGLGRGCAAKLGLTGAALDRLQDGPSLFDGPEPEDHCDGWDR